MIEIFTQCDNKVFPKTKALANSFFGKFSILDNDVTKIDLSTDLPDISDFIDREEQIRISEKSFVANCEQAFKLCKQLQSIDGSTSIEIILAEKGEIEGHKMTSILGTKKNIFVIASKIHQSLGLGFKPFRSGEILEYTPKFYYEKLT